MQHSGNRRSIIQATHTGQDRRTQSNDGALALISTFRRWVEAPSDTTCVFFIVSEVELHTDTSHSGSKIQKSNEKPTCGAVGRGAAGVPQV